jgi:hypothetical protein
MLIFRDIGATTLMYSIRTPSGGTPKHREHGEHKEQKESIHESPESPESIPSFTYPP